MEGQGKIRVLLVDDHSLMRQSLRSILESFPSVEVVGEASDGQEAIIAVGKLQPAVVVMDLAMQKMDGITAARMIKQQHPDTVVVGLSAGANDDNVYAMQKAGAFEVLPKENVLKDLYGAIQRAVAASNPPRTASIVSMR